MPIQAVNAVGAQGLASASVQSPGSPAGSASASQLSSSGTNEIFVRQAGGSEAQAPGLTESVATHVYDTIETLGVKLPPVQDGANSIVNKAKESLSPDSKLISAGGTQVKAEGNEALSALSKTFDHAVFMAMVNQVISGVGDTSRTLIKQT